MARLKIATFNINGVRAREQALLEWLEREQPDIACLQELKAPDEAFPQKAIEAAGYSAAWHGQKSWNGVAILARGAEPQVRRRGLPADPDPAQSRYLEADVHGLRVGCLYLPNGNPWPGPKFDYKLAWFAALRRHAAALLRENIPTVLCGDFNVVPTDELDIYDPKSWRTDALLQPESRDAWFELLAQGWTDALRTVHGDDRIYTFWDYFRRHWERNAGLRIDHLLLGPQLAPLLEDAGVDRWVRGRSGASDHAPTWVVLHAAKMRVAARHAGRAGKAGVNAGPETAAAASGRRKAGAGESARAGAGGAKSRNARARTPGAGSAVPRPDGESRPRGTATSMAESVRALESATSDGGARNIAKTAGGKKATGVGPRRNPSGAIASRQGGEQVNAGHASKRRGATNAAPAATATNAAPAATARKAAKVTKAGRTTKAEPTKSPKGRKAAKTTAVAKAAKATKPAKLPKPRP